MKRSARDSGATSAILPSSPISRWARQKAGCRLVVLFGSEPRGRAREGTDLDLAVLFDHPPGPQDRLRIIGELQDLAAPRDPDVFFLRTESESPDGEETAGFADGECLYEAEPGIFVGV